MSKREFAIKDAANSEAFYFQKGQDALNKWKNLKLDSKISEKLIELSNNYQELLLEKEKDNLLAYVVDLLFEVISYCDTKARDKVKFNQYPDNRAVARAGVRMNSWIEQLIAFKLIPEKIKSGSVQNAFDYLQDPINNSPMLSENHRALVSTKLFNKPYDQTTFISDLKTHFAQENLEIKNPANYTYVLMMQLYNDSEKWQESTASVTKEKSNIRYWLFAPGKQAAKWDAFYHNGEMAIAWTTLGDLKNYSDKTEIEAKLLDGIKAGKRKYNDALACYEFASVIQEGDIVIAKKGKREYVGWGIVNSDYFYDETKEEYQHRRKVEWKSNGKWYDEKGDIATKTLTDITKYPDYVERLKKLLMIDSNEIVNIKKDFIKWLITNPRVEYFDNKKSKYNEILKEYNSYFDKDIFKTSQAEYQNLKSYLDDQIYNNVNSNFIKYSEAASNHMPRAILGNKNYFKFLDEYFSTTNPTMETNTQHPLNTIFYGPPGTGKTYNTISRAAEIIENRTIGDYKEALQIFNENLHKRIEFITFHQNYSYEDFIQGLRPDTEGDGKLAFEKKDGVFKLIADRAHKNLANASNPSMQKRSFQVVFEEFLNPLDEGEVEKIEVQMKKVSFFITNITSKSIEFEKSSGDSVHTLSIATLEKMYENENVHQQGGLKTYYKPLLEKLLNLGKQGIANQETESIQNYVLIIDEINRANISRVFGELITLIEPNKRTSGETPLVAVLPSGDKFSVPSNLYLIGTMNTADKSIALLDIALRRRFEFEAMYPLYQIEGKTIHDADILKLINEEIIRTKGHDFQIGHSYFMDDNTDLIKKMNNKVIPLLLEYFMNDKDEVTKILKHAGLQVDKEAWPLKITGKK